MKIYRLSYQFEQEQNNQENYRMNRNVDIQSLKMQNFQLKNQITDLKNGFDLNRDVLKILSQQVAEQHPQCQIFYQIISRLTGINNQIMIANVELVQQKNKLVAENKKMQNTINNLSTRIEQIVNSNDCTIPKQISMQNREEMKELRSEIFALNEDCIRKKIQITRLEGIIREKQKEELKKPIIPTLNESDRKIKTQAAEIQNIPKKFETQGKVTKKVMQKNLERQNAHLKRLVEQLEYRLTLLTRLYQIEPFQQRSVRNEYQQEEQKFKKLTQNQLNLLMFAMNNTRLEQDSETDAVKVTITKRCKHFLSPQKKQKRTLSCSI